MTWRGWTGFAGSTSAVVLIYRNLWMPAALVGAGVLVLAVLFVRAEVNATRAMMREEPEPEPVDVVRVVRMPRPPWSTAQFPAIPSVPCTGLEGGRHRKSRTPRETVLAAITAAARVGLKN